MKSKITYLCTECGDTFSKWMGKCATCGSWNTIQEYKESIAGSQKTKSKTGNDLQVQKKTDKPLSPLFADRLSTGIQELDRVLGGGFFPGSLTLFGGAPGVGKSTLSLQIFLSFKEKSSKKAFYFSGEESVEQVCHRADRICGEGIDYSFRDSLFSTYSLEDIVKTIEVQKPEFAVIDSIQMVGLENAQLGSIAQMRVNAEILLKVAKQTGTALLVIGHMTKSDELAGPRLLEHIVDTVLQLEGDRNSEIRILRSPKNRFGSTLDIGVFEMQSQGLRDLLNPSEFFLSERVAGGFGSVITVMREGARNFLIEIQALTVRTNFGLPRRTSHGVDMAKLHLLLAVISKFTPFSCDAHDAYVNITSGMKLSEPSCDLAIIAALVSSRAEKEVPADTIVLGEVGLSGEVRSVSSLQSRIQEAEKLGFKRAIIPHMRGSLSSGMQLHEVKTVQESLRILFGA